MRRGEVWWANLPAPVGRRPVVLLSRNSSYRARSTATVVAVTQTIRDTPVEVILDESDGLPMRCGANLDDLLAVPLSLLEARVAQLSGEKMTAIERALSFALDLPRESQLRP